ncbi:MAG: hypothetical protein KC983_07550, partial [Phycisphaerales bacterium]|nr:hypothetical protein [Phycisphaerales bacterium]
IDLRQFDDARAILDAADSAVRTKSGDDDPMLAEIAEVYAELDAARASTEPADRESMQKSGPDSLE